MGPPALLPPPLRQACRRAHLQVELTSGRGRTVRPMSRFIEEGVEVAGADPRSVGYSSAQLGVSCPCVCGGSGGIDLGTAFWV